MGIYQKEASGNWKKIKENYKDHSTQILSDYRDFGPNEIKMRKEALQKMLLSLLKDLGLESKIGLFEGSIDNSNTTSKINWQRKKLNDSGKLTNENC